MIASLADQLRQFPRKRITLDELKRLFFALRPELVSSPTRNSELLNTLERLATEGMIRLPAEGSWEKRGNPPLPNWIQVVRDTGPVVDGIDAATVPWVPELGFWPELRPAALETAKAINDFLLRRRSRFQMVPIKERSLEIFGDEKRLDQLVANHALFGGRLPLSAIGAFQVPLPLPYRQADAPGKPALIVENHNTYWSFGEWNAVHQRYSAIVYGAGKVLLGSGTALDQVLHEVSGEGAEYLGDLDPTGIRIPLDFNQGGVSTIKVKPAVPFYRWLIAQGCRRELGLGAVPETALAPYWLGEALGADLNSMWKEGFWVPQEALGFEVLLAGAFD